MPDVFAYCDFAVRQPGLVCSHMQKFAIVHILAAERCFREIEGYFGHNNVKQP
jgi:hypothetical protein